MTLQLWGVILTEKAVLLKNSTVIILGRDLLLIVQPNLHQNFIFPI